MGRVIVCICLFIDLVVCGNDSKTLIGEGKRLPSTPEKRLPRTAGIPRTAEDILTPAAEERLQTTAAAGVRFPPAAKERLAPAPEKRLPTAAREQHGHCNLHCSLHLPLRGAGREEGNINLELEEQDGHVKDVSSLAPGIT